MKGVATPGADLLCHVPMDNLHPEILALRVLVRIPRLTGEGRVCVWTRGPRWDPDALVAQFAPRLPRAFSQLGVAGSSLAGAIGPSPRLAV